MGEQQIQLTEGKLEFQDFFDMVRLASTKTLYVIYGFFSTAILVEMIFKSISGVICALIMWGGFELYLRFTYKKRLQTSIIHQKEKAINITVSGIEVTTMDGSFHSITKWDEFCKVKESKKMFFLMTDNGGNGHFFFKKEFSSEQLVKFEKLIKNMLDSKLFVKENSLKYVGLGVVIQIALKCLTVVIDHF